MSEVAIFVIGAVATLAVFGSVGTLLLVAAEEKASPAGSDKAIELSGAGDLG